MRKSRQKEVTYEKTLLLRDSTESFNPGRLASEAMILVAPLSLPHWHRSGPIV